MPSSIEQTNGPGKVWLVRAGTKGEADTLFLKKKRVSLGPPEVGDLSELEANREAFKSRCREVFPDSTSTSIGGVAGQLYRFVHEVSLQDLVVYPSKKDGCFHIGRITGKYEHQSSSASQFPHRRKVRWICSLERSEMSDEFRREARAFKSFYVIKACADEVQELVGTK